MKRFLKSSFSIFLAITIVFSSAIVGLNEIDFSGISFENPFAVKSNAASIDDLTFELSSDGTYYSVSRCNSSASGELVIPSTYNGKPVTSIGYRAFYNYTSLTSITIPDGVTSIGYEAFCNCTSLTSVTMGDSITNIGSKAFNECTSLTSVYITDIVAWCNINFGDYPSNPLYYAMSLYLNSELVTDLVIPEAVTSIGSYAFYNCRSLTSITIPDSVTSIGYRAFVNCTSLESVTIGNGVTTIDYRAFYNCTSLKSITIPDNVTSIGEEAFSGCSSLTSVTMGKGVTRIGGWAFYRCNSLTDVYITDIVAWCNIVFLQYGSAASIASNPLYYADNLYLNGELVTDIVIPECVTSIGNYAFYGCKSLKSITIPDSVTSIGGEAFCKCTKLKSITIPDSVTSIGNGAFSYCRKLKLVTIPDSVTSIGGSAFSDCSNLTSIKIPDSVTSLGIYAFDNCSSLESVTIGNSVPTIGYRAFSGCKSLTSIAIGGSVKSIGEYAFINCSALKYVFYNGSEGAWNGLIFTMESYNDVLRRATIHYNSTGHTSSDWITGVEPTCTTKGSKYKQCSVCAEKVATETIPATGHTESDWIIDKQPTCTTNGSKYKQCSICAEKVATEIIPATGHTRSDWIVDVEATVDKEGSKHIECTVCGEKLSTVSLKQLKCDKPTLKSISNTEDGVKITWGNVTGSDSYSVYRKTSGGSYSKIGTTKNAYYTDKEVESGTKYYYQVKAENEAGSSRASGSNSISYLTCPTLKSIANTTSGVKITWGKVSGAEKYNIYRKTGSGSYSKITTTKNTYYTDKTAKSGKKYYYVVKAVKSSVTSAASNSKAVLHLVDPALKSISNTEYGVKITWGKVSGAEKYNVYRKTGSGSYSKLATTKNAYYTDKTAKSGTKYYYIVEAVKSSTTSAASSAKSILRLAVPTLKTPSNTTSGIKFTWSKVTGASGYIVYRKTKGGKWTEIGKTRNTYYTDKKAKSGTTYFYTVRAYSGSTKSYYDTDGVNIRRLVAPKISSATSGYEGILVKWNEAKGSSGYYVYRKASSGDWKKIATVKGSSKKKYLDETAKKGGTYQYRVKAYYGKTTSVYSNSYKIKCKY